MNYTYPKISVVMSCYNRAHYVKEAIESILAQTLGDFEFIIFDDCSTDNTASVIQSYADKDNRIIFIRNEKNMDYNYNLRKGFELAKGEYIARMDDDDISLPTRFAKQVSFLDKNVDIVVLGTFIELFGDYFGDGWVCETESEVLEFLMHFQNPMCHPSVMIRKSFLDEHKITYSPHELYAEEYHLWKEIIIKGGKLANLPEQLVCYRSHKKTVTQYNKTAVIQQKTALRVKHSLLNRFFTESESTKLIEDTKIYPFHKNDKEKLFNAFEKMKIYSNISEKTINYIQKKYCCYPCTMDIFFASDNNFAQHLCVAMTSILVNSYSFEKFNFYILDGGIIDENKQIINEIKYIKEFNIEYIKVDDSLFEQFPITEVCKHISKQTYYRYLIPQLKPDLDKSFYFDCDIVVENSLNEFWNIELNDNYIAGVEEFWAHLHTHYIEVLDLDKTINAGVMLINNKKWKELNLTECLFKTTNYLQENKLLKWQDEDVINFAFKNKILFVSPAYNLQQTVFFDGQHSQYSYSKMEESKMNPTIIHYSGNIKPWEDGCRHPLWERYYKYLNISPFGSKADVKAVRDWKKVVMYGKCHSFIYKISKNIFQKVKNLFKKKILNRQLLSREISPSLCKYKILGITVYRSEIKDYYQCRHFLGIRLYKKFRYQDFVSAQSAQLKSKMQEQSAQLKSQSAQLQSKIDEQSAQLESKIHEQSAQFESKMSTIVAEESSRALSVYSLHQKVFPKYKNIHQGQDIVVVATGPSLNDYVPFEGAVHIGVNKAFKYEKVKFDYLFTIDYPNIKSHIYEINNYERDNCKKFYGILKNPHDPIHIPDFEAKKAEAERFYVDYNNFNLEEEYPVDLSCQALASFWSITFHALQFALWTNPKRIYLVGCDESDLGHFNGDMQNLNLATNTESKRQHHIKHMDGWLKLKTFVSLRYPNTEIISINPVGLKGMFTDIFTID